ncbi:MAG: lipid-binding protein [Ginsengibacter sp.]
MKKIILILIIAAGIFILNSCQKVKDPGATSAVKVANEWWATLDSVGIPDYYGIGHLRIATYNTSANNGNIWVDDYKAGYGFQVQAAVDYTNLTFSSDAMAPNNYFIPGSTAFPETAHITDGKIFSKGGHSKSGNVADSIHFKIEFSDNPGFIYEMNGVERTRFPEDDY